MCFAPPFWARYLHHGAFIKVFSYPLLVLPSLLAVRTLILTPWALLICVFLQVFAEEFNCNVVFAAFVRAWQESEVTASQVLIQ